jgi:hypothetical protein
MWGGVLKVLCGGEFFAVNIKINTSNLSSRYKRKPLIKGIPSTDHKTVLRKTKGKRITIKTYQESFMRNLRIITYSPFNTFPKTYSSSLFKQQVTFNLNGT